MSVFHEQPHRWATVASTVAVSIALLALTSCSAKPPRVAAPSDTCSSGAQVHGAFADHPVDSGSAPIQVPTTSWVEIAKSQGDTVLAAGRSVGWDSAGAETPATLVRINGATGKVIARVDLSASAVKVRTPAEPTAVPAQPAWDGIAEMVVGPSTLYVLWQRQIDGVGQDQTLVAVDSCNLKIVATQALPPGNRPQQPNEMTYDRTTNSLWVLAVDPANPQQPTVASYNGTTLAPLAAVDVSASSNLGCLASAGGSIWFSETTLQRIDPAAGTSSEIPSLAGESNSCVLSDGTHLFLSTGRQFLELDRGTGAVTGRQALLAVSQVGQAHGQTWAVGEGQAGGGAVTPVISGAPLGTPVTTSYQILSASTTPDNVWLVDFAGNLFVL